MTATPEAAELAEMRRQYRYATAETHMLVDGVLHLRCHRCGERPIPHAYSHVLLCDPCLDEALAAQKAAPRRATAPRRLHLRISGIPEQP